MKNSDYYTLKGYMLTYPNSVTMAMEDYLEMIYRLSDTGPVRIKTLAGQLNVTPSSASKMADNLRNVGLISFERYGLIVLTREGRRLGESLVRRHEIINRLLCLINKTESELEETEKIEHYLSPRTIENINEFLKASSVQSK
jgi:Mn-dependent DtxR family transcriptional regulator